MAKLIEVIFSLSQISAKILNKIGRI